MTSQIGSLRADVLRRMVNEWLVKGCAVVIEPDGKIIVTPPAPQPRDEFDAVDMRRR